MGCGDQRPGGPRTAQPLGQKAPELGPAGSGRRADQTARQRAGQAAPDARPAGGPAPVCPHQQPRRQAPPAPVHRPPHARGGRRAAGRSHRGPQERPACIWPSSGGKNCSPLPRRTWMPSWPPSPGPMPKPRGARSWKSCWPKPAGKMTGARPMPAAPSSGASCACWNSADGASPPGEEGPSGEGFRPITGKGIFSRQKMKKSLDPGGLFP